VFFFFITSLDLIIPIRGAQILTINIFYRAKISRSRTPILVVSSAHQMINKRHQKLNKIPIHCHCWEYIYLFLY